MQYTDMNESINNQAAVLYQSTIQLIGTVSGFNNSVVVLERHKIDTARH